MADSSSDLLFSGIGSIIGSGLASSDIGSGINSVNSNTSTAASKLQPYNTMGQLTMPAIGNDLLGTGSASDNIGQGRVNSSTNPVDFESFAKNYSMSEGGKYDLEAGLGAQDSSSAAKGGLLSGANQRALTSVAEGVASKDLLSQYQAMLTGQNQDFNQRETSYNNIFGQEQLGEKSAASQAYAYSAANSSLSSLYGAQASASSSKGSGIGSAVSGISNLATKL